MHLPFLLQETNPSFSETMRQVYEWVDPETGHAAGFISDEVWEIIQVRKHTLPTYIHTYVILAYTHAPLPHHSHICRKIESV